MSDPVKLEVFIDGEYVKKEHAGSDVKFENEKAFVIIDEPRLYNVFDGMFGRHTLQLTANETGFSFNAFTFG